MLGLLAGPAVPIPGQRVPKLRRAPFHRSQSAGRRPVPAPVLPQRLTPNTPPGRRQRQCASTGFDIGPSLNPSAIRTVSLPRTNRIAAVGQSGLLGLTTSWRSTMPASR